MSLGRRMPGVYVRCLGLLCCLMQLGLLWAQDTSYTRSLQAYRAQEYDSALVYCVQAIHYFQENQYYDSLVLAYVHQADISWDTQGSQRAIAIANTAVAASLRLPESHLVRVTALNKKGQLLVHVARMEEARRTFQEAERRIPGQDASNGTVAALFNNISWLYLNLQLYEEALRYAERSLAIQISLYGEDARQLMGVYQSLGLIASGAGWFGQAEEYSLKLYELGRLHLAPDHPTMGLVHNQLVVVYESMFRYPEALRHLRAMVDVTQMAYAKSGNPQFLAIAYNNTGFLYHQLGENSLAEAYFEKALRLHHLNYGDEEIGIVQPLAHLAEAKRSLEKFEEADSLFSKAYQLQSKLDQENIRGLADLESQIGGLNEDRGSLAAAEKWYLQALGRYSRSGLSETTMVDETKTSLGKTYARQGRTAEALALHREVLGSYRKKYKKGNLLIAGKLNRISEAYRIAGEWDSALQYSDSTFLELLGLPTLPTSNWIADLPLSTSITEFLTNRAAILERKFRQHPQKDLLETIVALIGNYGVYLERSIPALRSQAAIVELAKKNKKLYQSGIHAAWILAENYGETRYFHTAFDFAERGKGLLLRLSANNLAVDEHARDEEDVFTRDRHWRGRISALNTQYLNTGGTDDVLLNGLSRAVEDYREFQDSVRQVGDPKWTERFNLRPYSVQEIRDRLLQKRQTLVEYAVTEEEVYIFLIDKDDFRVFRRPLAPILAHVAVLQDLPRLNAAEFVRAAYPLYRELIAPIAPYLQSDRLVIVPDGELFGINFEFLVSGEKEAGFSSLDYLIRQYEITYLLAASSAVPPRGSEAAKSRPALFLAPGFTDRMKQSYQARFLVNPLEDPIHAQLIRQPFSVRTAVESVAKFDGELYLEEEANERRFREGAAGYRILHLGTHAEVNHFSPLQSRLFLAKSAAQDTLQEDGILHAYEVYNLQLEAELAVLSACNTGSGKFQEGEGIISLAHSFLYAGCASVVMSMWAIDEKTSASILTGFYDKLSRGMGKGAALRATKLEFLDQMPDELAHPYYWAGLGLIGDAAPLAGRGGYHRSLVLAAVLLALALVGLWIWRRRAASGQS